ncbi:hypothetical protein [Terriglobus tenax]|uniref:hypothetical protein n=1 Tax=Terriglobus tenax TaxID=1111115 RepID=UPI0021E04B40|nr:hypothetical protein [Terriglobus tenax]
MYEQAVIPVQDQQTFNAVKSAVESSFSSAKVQDFLKSLDRAKLRIREFEQILSSGKLGSAAAAGYAKLGDGDKGMIRELYLSSLEKVALELRSKYLKVYAYY